MKFCKDSWIPSSISAFYLHKQKSFVSKIICGMLGLETLKSKIAGFLNSNTCFFLRIYDSMKIDTSETSQLFGPTHCEYECRYSIHCFRQKEKLDRAQACSSRHGHLYRWTENSFPIFLYLKPVEISKKCFNIT